MPHTPTHLRTTLSLTITRTLRRTVHAILALPLPLLPKRLTTHLRQRLRRAAAAATRTPRRRPPRRPNIRVFDLRDFGGVVRRVRRPHKGAKGWPRRSTRSARQREREREMRGPDPEPRLRSCCSCERCERARFHARNDELERVEKRAERARGYADGCWMDGRGPFGDEWERRGGVGYGGEGYGEGYGEGEGEEEGVEDEEALMGPGGNAEWGWLREWLRGEEVDATDAGDVVDDIASFDTRFNMSIEIDLGRGSGVSRRCSGVGLGLGVDTAEERMDTAMETARGTAETATKPPQPITPSHPHHRMDSLNQTNTPDSPEDVDWLLEWWVRYPEGGRA